MLKIGNLKLKSHLILSPMAGVSDLPFRLINRKFGCELAFVEMINARSISHKSKRTQLMLSSNAKDRPLGVQLLGKETDYILRAIDVLKSYKFDLLDFNAACPAKKVVRRQEGAALLREPQKLSKILKLIVKNSTFPVTAKIRIGWDKDSVNAKEIARLVEDAGVKALFVHGRTKVQGYSGAADYNAIRDVKKAIKIPVIASGDAFSGGLIKKIFDETGCDAVTIARGALGNPWIFRQTEYFLKKGVEMEKPPAREIVKVMLEHFKMNIDFYGERNGVVIFRKFFSWYTRGMRNVKPLREKSSRIKSAAQMRQIIEEASGQ